MKKGVFKYFDTFCYGELIGDEEDPNWTKPNSSYEGFGYSIDTKYVFYNQSLENIVFSMFCVGRTDFKKYLGEWFESKYDLPVSLVL
jgi:hypothetical protein